MVGEFTKARRLHIKTLDLSCTCPPVLKCFAAFVCTILSYIAVRVSIAHIDVDFAANQISEMGLQAIRVYGAHNTSLNIRTNDQHPLHAACAAVELSVHPRSHEASRISVTSPFSSPQLRRRVNVASPSPQDSPVNLGGTDSRTCSPSANLTSTAPSMQAQDQERRAASQSPTESQTRAGLAVDQFDDADAASFTSGSSRTGSPSAQQKRQKKRERPRQATQVPAVAAYVPPSILSHVNPVMRSHLRNVTLAHSSAAASVP